MANEIGDGAAPEIDTNDLIVDDNDDVDALKEKFQKVSEANKQLFARAKKAEGFELKDGKWVKPKVEKPREEPKIDIEPPKEPSRSNELDYGQLALLRTEGIKGSGEIALFKEIMTETGKSVLDVLDSGYFKTRLSEFREAQEVANAIPKGKNRSSQQATTDLDTAMAKFKETGELPDDFKTRSQVVNKMVEQEKSKNMFTGPSVIGPKSEQY